MNYRVQIILKRTLDIILSTIVFCMALPLMLVLAVLVKSTSKGPLFFKQERVGLNGSVFKMIKFRTMTGQPDKNSIRWSKSDADRITPIGSFMRDYGLDELPQILNILKGDMSIIGPRPPLPQQAKGFSVRERRMFAMRPGVLSLAAIEGRRSLPMERRYELHVQYVEQWSIKLDMRILCRTLFVVLAKESAQEKVVD